MVPAPAQLDRGVSIETYRSLRAAAAGPGGPSQLAQVERDALAVENERLRDENVQLRAMDVAFRELLNLADERSQGQLRVRVEQVGEQLADWLGAALESHT